MVEEVNDDEGDNATSNQKSLVFDRLHRSTSQQCPFMFGRKGKDKVSKPSMLQRLKGYKQSKSSVLARIKTGGKS